MTLVKRVACVALVAAAGSLACARPGPERQMIDEAAAALGGSERIQAVKTLTIEGAGLSSAIGSDLLIDTNTRVYTLTDYKYVINVAAERARSERVRTPTTPSFAGQAPVRQVQAVDGEVAFNIGANGNATRVTDRLAIDDRRADIYHHPLTIIRAALTPAATLTNLRTEGNESIVDVKTASGVNLTLAIDNTTKLPSRVTSMTASNDILGDVIRETSFMEYQEVSGLRLPARITSKVDRFKDNDIRVMSQSVDAEVGDLAAPASVVSAPATAAPPEPETLTVEEVVKGVWFIAGDSHHSVLVEFSDHLTLIESPNESRGLAVIAKARELRPGKPLTTLVNTHHHFDHSGGIRAAVSEGINTIITHKSNVAFYQEGLNRPHTLIPDALSKKPSSGPVTFVAVDDEMTLQDDTMTIVLYRILNNAHADNNLMIYFPAGRLLTQADIHMPRDRRTRGYAPFASNLLDNIKQRNLRVDRMMPLHGEIVPYSEFLQLVKDGFDRKIVSEPPPDPFTGSN